MIYYFRIKVFIFFSLFLLFYNTSVFSKNVDPALSEKNISNYFSGIISINQNNTSRAFDFLKKVKLLQDKHYNYNANFLRTLVLLGKLEESFDFAASLGEKKTNFYEANLLLGIKYFLKGDYSRAEKYFIKLSTTIAINSSY